MPDIKRLVVDFKDLATWMVKENDIHDGIWGIFARFGLNVVNAQTVYQDNPPVVRPAVVAPLLELGIQEYKEVNELSVDAAVVNPRARAIKKAATTRKIAKKR
jgi:hypothetical protein